MRHIPNRTGGWLKRSGGKRLLSERNEIEGKQDQGRSNIDHYGVSHTGVSRGVQPPEDYAGSNQFQKRVRCLECGVLLKKEILVVPAEKAKAMAKTSNTMTIEPEAKAKPRLQPTPKPSPTTNRSSGSDGYIQDETADYQEFLEYKRWKDNQKK